MNKTFYDEAVIEIDVQKQIGELNVDVNITAKRGVTSLFGRSGAGKSSIINMVAGLSTPDAGQIKVLGETLFSSKLNINVPTHKRRIGYVFQDARLFPHMTVRKNLEYGTPRNVETNSDHNFSDICELLGLNDLLARRPYNLSGGERQRVAIGRALLSYPKLLLMDEPLASLDLQRKSEIMPFIERLSDQFGIAVIYVSHSVEEVVRLSDTIALISDGKAIAQGSLSDVMNRIDLSPYTGRHEAGAVLNATVLETNAANGLSTLSVSGHTLWVPQIDLQANAPLRIRIRARDVALALSAPQDTSILNMLPATVREIAAHDGPHCELALEITPTASTATTKQTPEILIARITRRSLEQMNLKVGTALYAMMKAVAIDRRSLGGLGHGPRS